MEWPVAISVEGGLEMTIQKAQNGFFVYVGEYESADDAFVFTTIESLLEFIEKYYASG